MKSLIARPSIALHSAVASAADLHLSAGVRADDVTPAASVYGATRSKETPRAQGLGGQCFPGAARLRRGVPGSLVGDVVIDRPKGSGAYQKRTVPDR